MKTIIPLTLLVFLCSSCATITRGTTEVLSIQSDPSGAVARLSNGRTCVTPCSLELSRKQSLTIVFEKEGYRTSTAYVRPGVRGGGSAGVAGNVLLGGVIGIATDVASGANKDLIPNPVTVNLEKDED